MEMKKQKNKKKTKKLQDKKKKQHPSDVVIAHIISGSLGVVGTILLIFNTYYRTNPQVPNLEQEHIPEIYIDSSSCLEEKNVLEEPPRNIPSRKTLTTEAIKLIQEIENYRNTTNSVGLDLRLTAMISDLKRDTSPSKIREEFNQIQRDF